MALPSTHPAIVQLTGELTTWPSPHANAPAAVIGGSSAGWHAQRHNRKRISPVTQRHRISLIVA